MSDDKCPRCGLRVKADLDTPEKLMSMREVADMLGKPLSTLYRWRSVGKGPVGIKLGRSIGFRPSEVVRWMDDHQDEWRQDI